MREKLSVLAGTSLGTFPMGVTLCYESIRNNKSYASNLYHLLWNRTCALGLLDNEFFHNWNCVDRRFFSSII